MIHVAVSKHQLLKLSFVSKSLKKTSFVSKSYKKNFQLKSLSLLLIDKKLNKVY